MQKDTAIEIIERYCTGENFSEGKYCDRAFKIHTKNGRIFSVRRGNFLNWEEDDDTLIICLTRYSPPPKTQVSGELSWGSFFKDVFVNGTQNFAYNKKREEERDSAKKLFVKWRWITNVG
jgi:hypothetical protein